MDNNYMVFVKIAYSLNTYLYITLIFFSIVFFFNIDEIKSVLALTPNVNEMKKVFSSNFITIPDPNTGLMIDLPQNWMIKSNSYSGDTTFKPIDTNNVEVAISSKSRGFTYDIILQLSSGRGPLFETLKKLDSVEDAYIAGIPAVKMVYTAEDVVFGEIKRITILSKFQGPTISFVFTAPENEFHKYSNIIPYMINSLKIK